MRGALASVTVVTVNWNSGDFLRACLAALSNSPADAALVERFVIVDNGSSDGSEQVTGDCPFPVVFIRNRSNIGFAAACNRGASAAVTPYLLFLNPDTQVKPLAIKEAVDFLDRPCNQIYAACGVQLIDDKGVIQRSCARHPGVGNLIYQSIGLSRAAPRLFPGMFLTEFDHETSRDVPHVMGAFLLVREKVFRELHGFDERFFVYLEDLDFSVRLARAGYRSYFLASARVQHVGGGTSRQVPAHRMFYSLSSRLRYASKHLARWQAMLVSICTFMVEPGVRLAVALATFDFATVRWTASAYAMLFRDEILGAESWRNST